jgi:DNA-binding transcriptional LysR family regulator
MLPDIDSLALFVRAAELRSLTKAAEASHLGLAAASRRIALLEERFKTSLLARSSRGVELTPAGSALIVHAKAMLLLMNQMQADMSDHAAGRKGSLRIMASTSAMNEFLPEDLADFTRLNPDVRLVLQERWSAKIIRAVQAGEVDLGIIIEGSRHEGLEVFPYRMDRLAVVMPQGHALSELLEMRFEDVLAHDLVALESGSSMMRLLTEQAVVTGSTLQLRVQVRSFEAVCRMVQSGLGVGLLPFQAASVLAKGLNLAVKPLQESWAVRRLQVCVKKDHAPNTSLTRMLEHLSSLAPVTEHTDPINQSIQPDLASTRFKSVV